MKVERFSFYKVQKNEDAIPYIRGQENKGLIVVADGLGGSGSFVHKLVEKDYNHSLFERLKDVILPEYYREKEISGNDDFNAWLNELIAPMADAEPDTSALWGSRIAIARFVYYLNKNCEVDLKDRSKRAELTDYIYKGLLLTAKEFKLESVAIKGQLTLPTTLAGIQYEDKGDGIHIDAIWAGDSRAYALLPGKGLKQLSKDDEDASGAINNLFALKEGRPLDTKLRLNSYVLPKKSAVFVCSDGIFDPYAPLDNIGVEAVLLNCLSEAGSFDELKQKWFEHYKPMTHDDCSVSFVSFGFESFKEFKDSFIGRTEDVITTLNDYFNYKKIIPVVNGDDENPEQYIRARAEQRKGEIARIIADNIVSEQVANDEIVPEEFVKLYANLKEKCKKNNQEKERNRKEEVYWEIYDYLHEDCSKVRDVFRSRDDIKECGKAENKVRYLVFLADELTGKRIEARSYIKSRDEAKKILQAAYKSGDDLKASLSVRVGEIKSAIYQYEKAYKAAESAYEITNKYYGTDHKNTRQGKDVKEYYLSLRSFAIKAYEKIAVIIKYLGKRDYKKIVDIINSSGNKNNQVANGNVYNCDANYITELNNVLVSYEKGQAAYSDADKKVCRYEDECVNIQKKYDNQLSLLCSNYLSGILDDPKRCFTESACDMFGLPIRVGYETVTIDSFADEIEKVFEYNAKTFDDIIKKFMYSESSTIIDPIFNPSRLRLCRFYKTADIEKVKKLIDKINYLLTDYEDISDICEKS